jgi:hypothetical protein
MLFSYNARGVLADTKRGAISVLMDDERDKPNRSLRVMGILIKPQ